MTVIAGAEALRPPSTRELAVLSRNGAGPDQRLSCQCAMPRPGVELIVTTGYW
jgi:ferredoxin